MSKKIALINLTRMGDLLMTAPMIAQLRQEYDDAEIHLLVVEGFAAIADGLDVDRVIPVDYNGLTTSVVRAYQSKDSRSALDAYKKFARWTTDLQKVEYDGIYNITHTRVSAVLTSLMRGKVVAGIRLDLHGYRRVEGDWGRYWFAGNLNRGINPFHLVDLNIAMAQQRGSDRTNVGMHYELHDGCADARADELLESKGLDTDESFVVFQVGASAEDKRWEAEKFGVVAADLTGDRGVKALFTGTAEELPWVEKALTVAGDSAVSVAGDTDLPVLAELLRRAELVVSNDTGTMHLAQAVGTRVIAITLGSALSDETGPYGEGNVIVEPDIDCFPCDFKATCTVPVCHERISPKLVGEIAKRMLDDSSLDGLNPTELDSQAVVWTTGFDERGWWKKFPLAGLRVKRNDVVRVIYREALRSTFEAREAEIDSIVDVIKNEYRVRFPHSSIASIVRELGDEPERLEKLRVAVREAANVAKTIDRHSSDGAQMLPLLAREGESLAKLDESLLEDGLQVDLLKPAMAIFRFGLENLPEEGLAEQAREMVRVHGELTQFMLLIKAILARLEGESKQTEVCSGNKQRMDGIQVGGSPERLRRARLRGETLKVLLPTNGYYLQSEVASALTTLGHKVVPIPFEDRDDVISRLLTESLDADLLLTINHLGFDRDGELASLLHRIDMPYISWFVDRPSFILLDHEVGPVEHAHIATWERESVDELLAYGFEEVEWLPLATDEKRFRRTGKRSGQGALRFVANSMIEPVTEWLGKAGKSETDPVISASVIRLIEMRIAPELAVKETLKALGRGVPANREEWLNLCSAVALTATLEYRKRLVGQMSELDFHLYGDEGWQVVAPNVPWHGHVEYPRGLAEVYRDALHLNATSFQMPTAVNQRVFDIPAAGGVVITDHQSSLDEMFDTKNECLTYETLDDARDKAQWALANQEKAFQMSGRAAERIAKQHTYRHRMAGLLAELKSRHAKSAVRIAGGKG